MINPTYRAMRNTIRTGTAIGMNRYVIPPSKVPSKVPERVKKIRVLSPFASAEFGRNKESSEQRSVFPIADSPKVTT